MCLCLSLSGLDTVIHQFYQLAPPQCWTHFHWLPKNRKFLLSTFFISPPIPSSRPVDRPVSFGAAAEPEPPPDRDSNHRGARARERVDGASMAQMKYLIEVEKGKEARDGRPSVGPVYRSAFARDGFPPPVPGLESCWDVFRWVVARPARRPGEMARWRGGLCVSSVSLVWCAKPKWISGDVLVVDPGSRLDRLYFPWKFVLLICVKCSASDFNTLFLQFLVAFLSDAKTCLHAWFRSVTSVKQFISLESRSSLFFLRPDVSVERVFLVYSTSQLDPINCLCLFYLCWKYCAWVIVLGCDVCDSKDYPFHRMTVKKYPNNPMLGRREIVRGKVRSLMMNWSFFFCITYYFLPWYLDCLRAGWRICMANVQRSTRYSDQSWKCYPELWCWTGKTLLPMKAPALNTMLCVLIVSFLWHRERNVEFMVPTAQSGLWAWRYVASSVNGSLRTYQ